MRSLVAAALAAVLIALAAPPVGGQEDADARAEALIRKYRVIAFGAEYDPDPRPVQKWVGAVRIRVHGDTSYRGRAEALGVELSGLTGLEIAIVETGGNLHLRMLSADEYFAFAAARTGGALKRSIEARRSACFGLAVVNDRDEVIGGHAVVNLALAPIEIEACIVEEVTQLVTGLFNDSNLPPRPSLFSYRYFHSKISATDAIMIRAHFDPALVPSMAADDAIAIVRPLIRAALAREP